VDRKGMGRMEEKFLRLRDVLQYIPVGRTTWYELIKQGRAPRPIKVGHMSLWKASDLQKMMKQWEDAGGVEDR